MRLGLKLLATAALAALLGGSAADAAQIRYRLTGAVSGSYAGPLGSGALTAAPLEFKFYGDTSFITPKPLGVWIGQSADHPSDLPCRAR